MVFFNKATDGDTERIASKGLGLDTVAMLRRLIVGDDVTA